MSKTNKLVEDYKDAFRQIIHDIKMEYECSTVSSKEAEWYREGLKYCYRKIHDNIFTEIDDPDFLHELGLRTIEEVEDELFGKCED